LALNGPEVKKILNDKEGGIKVDGRIRKDHGFPAGVMDVISIDKTNQHYRVLYDVKGRFILKSLKGEEAKTKLCRIKRKEMGPNKIPYIVTHDGRTIRYPHPDIAVLDTVKFDIESHKIVDHVKFEIGNVAYITGGNNRGRVGIITVRERHLGGFDIVHLRDERGHNFATRIGNVFIIGKGKKSWISLPKERGIYVSPLEHKQDVEKKTNKKAK